jgi:hypothetical protein
MVIHDEIEVVKIKIEVNSASQAWHFAKTI